MLRPVLPFRHATRHSSHRRRTRTNPGPVPSGSQSHDDRRTHRPFGTSRSEVSSRHQAQEAIAPTSQPETRREDRMDGHDRRQADRRGRAEVRPDADPRVADRHACKKGTRARRAMAQEAGSHQGPEQDCPVMARATPARRRSPTGSSPAHRDSDQGPAGSRAPQRRCHPTRRGLQREHCAADPAHGEDQLL